MYGLETCFNKQFNLYVIRAKCLRRNTVYVLHRLYKLVETITMTVLRVFIPHSEQPNVFVKSPKSPSIMYDFSPQQILYDTYIHQTHILARIT